MKNAPFMLGDCLEAMARLPDACIDAIVTDPPYGLNFMGKAWDHGVPGVPCWQEALRVAKPGAYLAAFGGTRTSHRLACAIEDAGWEIRDTIAWMYGQGFPKSHNGPWGGTALKPAFEPIILARKPLIGTVAANALVAGSVVGGSERKFLPSDSASDSVFFVGSFRHPPRSMSMRKELECSIFLNPEAKRFGGGELKVEIPVKARKDFDMLRVRMTHAQALALRDSLTALLESK